MEWFNQPPRWTNEGATITITSAGKTDFWRKTHYGFVRDNGHFYYQTVKGDFVIEVKITGQYNALYDQAGIMIRQDESTWMKSGIEYLEGTQQASAVVTREFSDWSVVPLFQNPPSLWLRASRTREAVEVQYSLDGKAYHLLRIGYLSTAESLQAGLLMASPEGDGFTAVFEGLTIRPK